MVDKSDNNQTPTSKSSETGNQGNAAERPGLTDFAPEKLTLSQDFLELCKTKTRPTHISVEKPSKKQFFRVHPKWRMVCAVFEDEEASGRDRKYLVLPDVYRNDPEFAGVCRAVTLFYCIYRSGSTFLWNANIPNGGNGDSWHESGLDIAGIGSKDWVQMQSNMAGSCYIHTTPQAAIPDPLWPDMTQSEVYELAFRGRVIDSSDHPVVRRYKGLE